MNQPTDAQIAFINDLTGRILAREIDPNQPKLKFKVGVGNVDSKGRVHILNSSVITAQSVAREVLAAIAAGTETRIGASNLIDMLKLQARRAGC